MNRTKPHNERIEKALAFVEDRLKSPVRLDEVAEVACYSKYHLIRIFQSVTGETVMDYLRKRRISQSGTELITTSQSILEVALAYQFESQEAFTRSFQQVFGMPPGLYRKRGHRRVSFDRYTLSQKDLEFLANYQPMEPKIVDIDPKLLVGQHTTTQLADNQIPKLWQGFMPRKHEVKHRTDELYYAVHRNQPGLKIEDFTPHTVYQSWACVEVSQADPLPEGMISRTLEGGKYAIFIHKGPVATFRSTFEFIHYQWMPSSPYELDSRDHFEVMGPKYHGPTHPDSEEEVWIPIRKKTS